MSNVLIVGDRGNLGSFLSSKIRCDVLGDRKLGPNGFSYDVVINCIGIPNVEFCEENPAISLYSNAEVIFDLRHFFKPKLIINFSSYYVYDGEGLSSETDTVCGATVYARHKLLSEDINKDGVNFRIGKLFGHCNPVDDNKFVGHCITSDRVVADDAVFNPTSADTILRAVRCAMTTKSFRGTYNLSNSGTVSHYDFAMHVNSIMGDNKVVVRSEMPIRRFRNYGRFAMDTTKISRYIDVEPWQNDLLQYIRWYSMSTSKR